MAWPREVAVQRRFVTLDVFTDRRFVGNPLAVVLDAEGLDTETMQAIAREFNYPETVFVLAPLDQVHRARVRIFTPARELPFAGHPTVGTAVLLGHVDDRADAREIVLEEGIGPVRCLVEPIDSGRGRAQFVLPQLPSKGGAVPGDAAIAQALGLSPGDIGCAGMRPSTWSAGLPVTLVPVASLAAVRNCRPDPAKLLATLGDGPVYLFSAEAAEPGHDFHARMFAPALGVPEDPATGSAAAALAGLLAAGGRLHDGDHAFAIEQGYEMGRPSLIRLALTTSEGELVSAAVGGDAVIVTQGNISL
jgi:trans-2,3-dihydro-3-hydroxyanthranilate isomerase